MGKITLGEEEHPDKKEEEGKKKRIGEANVNPVLGCVVFLWYLSFGRVTAVFR